jgi:hypothetical protein
MAWKNSLLAEADRFENIPYRDDNNENTNICDFLVSPMTGRKVLAC